MILVALCICSYIFSSFRSFSNREAWGNGESHCLLRLNCSWSKTYICKLNRRPQCDHIHGGRVLSNKNNKDTVDGKNAKLDRCQDGRCTCGGNVLVHLIAMQHVETISEIYRNLEWIKQVIDTVACVLLVAVTFDWPLGAWELQKPLILVLFDIIVFWFEFFCSTSIEKRYNTAARIMFQDNILRRHFTFRLINTLLVEYRLWIEFLASGADCNDLWDFIFQTTYFSLYFLFTNIKITNPITQKQSIPINAFMCAFAENKLIFFQTLNNGLYLLEAITLTKMITFSEW